MNRSEAEREKLYAILREIHEDYINGNLPESVYRDLRRKYEKKLENLRRSVCKAFREEAGPDLDFEDVNYRIEYLEAYKRYAGDLYSKISAWSWDKLSKSGELNLIIIFTLYGIVNWNEQIRNYNRTMDDHIHLGRRLKT